ncbi:MAG: DNA mismatch repair endonuclease MutH [Proteobacteria bacterium]|nr:DNA mismatch repair endonuclease MutH [Pseudomonadota bacterium]
MIKILAPSTIEELLARAFALAGKTLQDIANQQQDCVPNSLLHAKGWIGQLIEKVLGASAMNLDQPDFVNLGVELKTLPITPQGIPVESTYICSLSLPNPDRHWEHSRVKRKMTKILWVPIESHAQKPLGNCRIGTPILWSAPAHIEAQLRQDWEELIELVVLGHFDKLSAQVGKFLQIRPKAANSKTFIQVIDHQGNRISTVPKGFYLRTLLTRQILSEHYILTV